MALFLISKPGTQCYKRNGEKFIYLGTGFYPSQDHVFARPGKPTLFEPYAVSIAYEDSQDGLSDMKRDLKGLKIIQMNEKPSVLQNRMLQHIKAQCLLNGAFRKAQLEGWFPSWNPGVRTQTIRALIKKGYMGRDYCYDEDEGTIQGMVFFVTSKGNIYKGEQ